METCLKYWLDSFACLFVSLFILGDHWLNSNEKTSFVLRSYLCGSGDLKGDVTEQNQSLNSTGSCIIV